MKYFYTLILLTALNIQLFAASSVAKPVYLKGWYCDSANAKHEGYIWYDEMNFNTFYYKKDLNSEKEKLGLDDAKGFSFDNRFFKKVEDVKLSNGLWKFEKPVVFAEVIAEGKASVYCVFGKIQQSTPVFVNGSYGYYATKKQLINYLIRPVSSNEYELLSKNKSKFQEQISEFLKDNIALSASISAKGYTIDNIKEIIEEYNR